MIIKTNSYQVVLLNEPTYTPGSRDNVRQYSKEFLLTEGVLSAPPYAISKYGINLLDQDGIVQNNVLIAASLSVEINEHTALIQDHILYLAIADQVCSLSLPDLELTWHQKVDPGACFGVYYSIENRCLISHGEQDITCLNFDGSILWNVSGKDIFSEGFYLYPNHIEVVDFNQEMYRIEISSGKISLI